MNDVSDILTAFRRSERALVEQVAQWESLDFGVAYWSTAFPSLAEANQLRDVWLSDVSAEEAFARADAYFTERGTKCSAWTPASSQAVEPVAELLLRKGWQRVEAQVMALAKWDTADVMPDASVRILPARAMRKAYRATFEGESARGDAVMERLNDSNLDAFVAIVDGAAAGRISYLSVGDAARVTDAFVLSEFRRRRIGVQLMGHVLRLARRLLPKSVVAAGTTDAGHAFLAASGFEAVGVLASFHHGVDSI
ncbi:MAG: GNAT family N-acetyltransferase [Planctomycetota bacterium]